MAEYFIVALVAYVLGQLMPRNAWELLTRWRDRLEARPQVAELTRDELLQQIFSRPDAVELLREIVAEARRRAKEAEQ